METTFVYLGVSVDSTLSLKPHMATIRKGVGYKLHRFHNFRDLIEEKDALIVYKYCILPSLEYCSFILDSATVRDQQRLQTLQNRGLRKCLGIKNPLDITEEALHTAAEMDTLSRRRDVQLIVHTHKLSKKPEYVVHSATNRTRGDMKIHLKVNRPRLTTYKKSPLYRGMLLWDVLDPKVQQIPGRAQFKNNIKKLNFVI